MGLLIFEKGMAKPWSRKLVSYF